jgi:hypothetical protein
MLPHRSPLAGRRLIALRAPKGKEALGSPRSIFRIGLDPPSSLDHQTVRSNLPFVVNRMTYLVNPEQLISYLVAPE